MGNLSQIIAIVGPIGAGKTTLAEIISEIFGYERYKLTVALYQEADKQNLDREDRVALQDLGDKMRKDFGLSVLADRFIQNYDKNKKYVIESIRNHHELIALENEFGDYLSIISIEVPAEIRYQRVVERKGQYKEQNLTFEEFLANDKRDLGQGNSENEQNVLKCIEMADRQIVNDAGIEELKQKVRNLLSNSQP